VENGCYIQHGAHPIDGGIDGSHLVLLVFASRQIGVSECIARKAKDMRHVETRFVL